MVDRMSLQSKTIVPDSRHSLEWTTYLLRERQVTWGKKDTGLYIYTLCRKSLLDPAYKATLNVEAGTSLNNMWNMFIIDIDLVWPFQYLRFLFLQIWMQNVLFISIEHMSCHSLVSPCSQETLGRQYNGN